MSAKSMVLFKPSECIGNPYFNIVVEIKVSPPSSTCKTLSSRPVKIKTNTKSKRKVRAAMWDLKLNEVDFNLRGHMLKWFKIPFLALYPRVIFVGAKTWIETWLFIVKGNNAVR